MRIKEFTIEEGIIHVLDVNLDEPILNEAYLDLSKEDINIFLIKHIEKILKDEELERGEFIETSDYLGLIYGYLCGDGALIDVSKRLSSLFFEYIKENDPYSCDLLFLKLTTEFGPCFMMIKLDYIKNYTHKIDYLDNKMIIDIVSQSVSLPMNLQKSTKAFLILRDYEDNMNAFIIDKKKNGKSINNYFKDEFLKFKTIKGSYSQTKDLITGVEKWTRQNIKDDAERAFSIREALKEKVINEESLNIADMARELLDGDHEIKSFMDFTENKGIDGDISINKEYVSKKYERIRLKIDKDIDLYIDKDSFYDINRFEVKRNGDGSLNMTIKYILNYNEK